ncbi:MAG TPA: nucleoside-diphosphate sugar epimerase/dehydratase [Alphaproteobacteria bacterium]|nr:nucleoside-diphosphate sugar epimerase/dehydratase [Alphaproteobacteria bacterium]
MTLSARTVKRGVLILAFDTLIAAGAFVLSLWLRLGEDPTRYAPDLVQIGTPIFAAIAAVLFLVFRLPQRVWRFTSLDDLFAIVRAVSLAILLFVLALFWVTRLELMPRSSLVICWFVLVMALGTPRVLFRIHKDRGLRGLAWPRIRRKDERIPVALVGVSHAAENFIRAMNAGRGGDYRVVGIVDERGDRVGRRIHDCEVAGSLEALDAAVARIAQTAERPQRLLIADEHLAGPKLRSLVERADALGIPVARLPRATDFRSGMPDRAELRPVAIEDLLGRPQTVLDRARMQDLIKGKRVLVTGAGGTIGGELARQIATYGPARLALLDASEFALYTIDSEIGEKHPALPRAAVLADVRDRERVHRVVAGERPELVFHAAALKHVPMVENHPLEGLLTNVIGTRNVADACRASAVAAMVMISTDKAVNPSSIMGATKRLAECYNQALNIARGAAPGTVFVTVRFGNVLGSTGSVVPLFERQLKAGGPLTVTHPEVKRYFMTVREAVELVLEASVLGIEGAAEAGDSPAAHSRLFVLDMGEPVKIVDLARQMIRLAGLRPEHDIAIAITGLRPGEKLSEELFHAAEPLEPTRYGGILTAQPRTADLSALEQDLARLEARARGGDESGALGLLAALVPEYAAAAPASAARA